MRRRSLMTSPSTLEQSINSKPVPRVPVCRSMKKPCAEQQKRSSARGRAKIGRAKRRSIQFVEHLTGDGPTVFEHVCRMGLEGIVSKRTDAPYRSGPSKAWLKSKNPASAGSARRSGADREPIPMYTCGQRGQIPARIMRAWIGGS